MTTAGAVKTMPRVTLLPSGFSFDVPDGATVLAAGLAAGAPLPRSCRNGTCRTCRARVVEGRAEHTVEWPGLLPEELAAGWILPCVARTLSSTLVIELP
jgi:ferredoxin